MGGCRRRRLSIAVLLVAAHLTAGCAGLLLRPEDPPDENVARFLVRATLAVATLGVSEIAMSRVRDRHERRHDHSDYWERQHEVRTRWREALEDRRTLDEVSDLFESGPLSCTPVSARHHVCVWMSPLEDTVYVTVGLGVHPLRIGTVVRAVCRLPLDGSPRPPDTCRVWSE